MLITLLSSLRHVLNYTAFYIICLVTNHPDDPLYGPLETTGRKELVRLILSWIPDVMVLVPKRLRNRIAKKLDEGLRAQRDARHPKYHA